MCSPLLTPPAWPPPALPPPPLRTPPSPPPASLLPLYSRLCLRHGVVVASTIQVYRVVTLRSPVTESACYCRRHPLATVTTAAATAHANSRCRLRRRHRHECGLPGWSYRASIWLWQHLWPRDQAFRGCTFSAPSRTKYLIEIASFFSYSLGSMVSKILSRFSDNH